jgi:hypothetical protein
MLLVVLWSACWSCSCRAWLDLQTDAMLLDEVEQQVPGAAQEMLGASGQDDLVSNRRGQGGSVCLLN